MTVTTTMLWYLVIVILTITTMPVCSAGNNLTCYQCHRSLNEECGKESLQVCPPSKDRCVTHISKDPANGFVLKRECGLGPCGFEDDMVNRGLGLEGCDRSKDEYFCIFCCRENGCNKSSSSTISPTQWLILIFLIPTIFHSTVQIIRRGVSVMKNKK